MLLVFFFVLRASFNFKNHLPFVIRYGYKTQLQTCIKSYSYVLAFETFLSSFFVVSFSFLVVPFAYILYECFPLVAIIHYSIPFI